MQADGRPLPSARNLTLTLLKNVTRICNYKNNELLVPWGQFVAHDLAYSPVNTINSTFPGKIVSYKNSLWRRYIYDFLV